ncbi:hypothetical protein PAHAL_5G146700 [Panicum hallii]|uniref:Uncharacterized protein n=1 Tax=Panicum hallii TaxID=206008 RepID=A0A2S3HRE3_9POAL|nr:uncharacterized protein LOC112894688 [Panicum hallii]PAN28342.1 hypothetical protein PAHAL_5G146700 [Panicum hallii]
MDFPKREGALPPGAPRRSPKAMRPGAAATEADENASPKRPVPAWAASPQRKKVLGERNDGGMEAAASPPLLQPKPAASPPTLTGRGAGAYDPKTNYTTPRPEFLRYDPERRREILLRVARAAEVEYDDCSSAASGSAASEDDGGSVASDAAAAASPVSSARWSDSEAELDDSDEEEEEEVAPPRRGRWARRLFLLLVAVACSFCYMSGMNPAASSVCLEDGFDFMGPIGGTCDAGEQEVDSLSLLGAVYMMGPEDVLEETRNQFVHGDTEGVVHLYDQRASPKNLVAATMMGIADMCINAPLGELTCQIGVESSENVADSNEDSEVDEHKPEVAIESFKKNEQSCEVSDLGGNISSDSIGSSSTHTADMEESSSGLDHQEEGEDHSNQSVMQLVSTEKAMESSSAKLNYRSSLESQELNLDTELWQYENTAEAAKAICSTAKFLWSAMEPHLLQILACFSVAGFVAVMFRYFQRSRKMVAPASQHMPSKSPAEVPALVPHHTVQLPVVPPSPQAVQLPVYSLQEPTQLTVPKQGLSGSLEVPMELPLPKPDPFVSLKVPVDHGNRDQKLQQRDANNTMASNGDLLKHRDVDSSKPPVVELLGEFTFADSSRGRAIKSLNQYAGGAAIQELPEKDVDKMQMNSSISQTHSVQRGRKEENSVRREKTDVTPAPLTPTPLRRSSRLRSKVTTP